SVVPSPSYDDLTPSIPDVSARDLLRVASGFSRKDVAVAERAHHSDVARSLPPEGGSHTSVVAVAPDALYAALHDDGAIERLVAIARDFSPRIERHPGGTVVFDVSGLTRLFGDAASIAEHLARAGA